MDAEEFGAFYAASSRRLDGQLTAMTGDDAEAADAVQEAFVRAWERRRRLDADGAPEAATPGVFGSVQPIRYGW